MRRLAEPVPSVPGKGKAQPGDEPGRDRVRVLNELKSLIDSFPAKVRQQVIASIHAVLAGLTP